MPLWITRHGPLYINDAKEHLALRWAAAEPGSFQFPFPELNKAGNWQEFTRALARFPGPAQNFVYADVDGNIGYHATGLLPIRKGYTGDVPVDGSSGENEWQGFIPFDQLPVVLQSAGGCDRDRESESVPARLPLRREWQFRIALPLAADSKSAARPGMVGAPRTCLRCRRMCIPASPSTWRSRSWRRTSRHKAQHGDLREPVQLLRGWNGQMDKDAAAPLIALWPTSD